MHKGLAIAVVAGALALTGGAATILPSLVAAADPTASPSATASTTGGSTGSTSAPATVDHQRCHGGPGGLDADDLTAAAKALGMTEADLTTALESGQTTAAVAKAKGVDVQKVIDAIVASDKAEFAAAVTAGTMTQAQADQMSANLTAHVTDEVNGVAGGGPGGHGHGGPGGQTPATPSSTTTDS